MIEDAAKTKGKGLLDFVQKTALNTYASSQKLQEIGKNYVDSLFKAIEATSK